MEKVKMNLSYLKELLYNEIATYYRKLDEIKSIRIELTEIDSLIELFKKISGSQLLIDKYLGNVKLFFESKKINGIDVQEIIGELENKSNEYQTRLNQIKGSINEDTIKSYQIIMNKIKNNIEIKAYDYSLINELLNSKGIDVKDRIQLLETLRFFNIECCHGYREVNRYEIINMLNFGYEILEIPEIRSNKISLINDLSQIIISSTDKNEYQNLIPVYNGNKKFTNGLNYEEYNYLLITILKRLQDEMYKLQKELCDLNIYRDPDYRKLYVSCYYENLAKYTLIRNIMNSELKKYQLDSDLDNDTIENKELEDCIDLNCFLRPNGEKTYFEVDFNKLPLNLQDLAKETLYKYQKNIGTTSLKSLKPPLNGFFEIKENELRIVLKHIAGNAYGIVGIFQKSDYSVALCQEYSKRFISSYVKYDEINLSNKIGTRGLKK